LKKGNNIAEQMKPPKGSTPSVYEVWYEYKNSRTGAVKKMSADEYINGDLWKDSSWQLQSSTTKLIRKGNDTPPLQNFSFTTLNGVDSTSAILNYPGNCVLYFVNPEKNNRLIDTVFWNRTAAELPVFIITSTPDAFTSDTASRYQVLYTDATAFRIAARANPTIYLLRQGTVLDKWPLARMKSAAFKNEIKNK
jgi:hypothetical protein